MNFFKTIAVAFSMFSSIPMPFFEWDDNNTKYMLIAFPLVGVVCGVFSGLILYLSQILNLSNFTTSILLVVLPVIITGGIHLDGYCDTKDALSSHQNKERKLQILSDPHIGAFGVLSLICYLALYMGLIYEIKKDFSNIILITCIYIISRCFSGIGVTTINSAKDNGLAKTFSESADKKMVKNILILFLILLYTNLFFFYGISSIILILIPILTYISWNKMIIKEFGGLTGDLSGYLTQKLELYMLIGVLLMEVFI